MDAYGIKDSIAQASVGLSGGNYLRVSMVAAGAEPVEFVETSAPAKSGRLDAWLDRFWVPLFSASARPTSAAL